MSRYLALILMLAFSLSDARAQGCTKRGLVVIEIGANGRVQYDGVPIDVKDELSELRSRCASKLVLLVSPFAKVEKVADMAFYSAKLGNKANSGNFFVFIESRDKSRMIFIPTMATVSYSRDPAVLGKLISHPPTEDNFF